jgi:2-polyprenyl-6-methoxyphenol hydroxylase-like FAD-dependent oxidoreductase
MPKNETQVLICGAGPIGLGLSLALARCGVAAIVVEKKSALDPHSRALGIAPRTMEIFRAWNCLDPFLENGVFLKRPQIWMAGRSTPLATLNLGLLENFTAAPGLLILPQDQTERLLLEEVRSAQQEVRFGHELLHFTQDENGVTARIRGESGEYSVDAKFLVGCDGAHSHVREILRWKLDGKTYPTRVLICDIELHDARDELPWPRTALLPCGVLVALRYAPHHWRIIHTLAENQNDELALSQSYIASLVEKLFGAGVFETLWSSTFRIHCRRSACWVERRVMICGDAAHLNSPAGGQGMNSGLQDAHNLAWKLAAILNGGNAKTLLSSFEIERKHEIQTGVERYTDLLTRVLFLASPTRRNALILLARLALRFPFARQKLALRATMLDTHYLRSPILKRTSSLVGSRAPDGEISRSGENKRLLDCVFPHALLVLFDDGKLPRWNEDEIRAGVEKSAPTNVRVLRLTAREVKDETAWRDASGKIFRAWKIESATAALIRPDGHVGWISNRPSHEELQAGIKAALGA